MKNNIAQSMMKTAFIAVLAVVGSFAAAHAAHASNTVTFSLSSGNSVSCQTATDSGPEGSSCTLQLSNGGTSGGETLQWSSVNINYQQSQNNWLSVSPQQYNGAISGGNSVPVTFSIPSGSASGFPVGNYTANVTFNGQSNSPCASSCNTSDSVTVNLNVGQQVGNPGGPNNGQPSASTSSSCGSVQLTWTSAQNADSYDVYRNGSQILSHYSGLSYTDSSVTAGSSYSYTIDGYSQSYGTSTPIAFNPSSVTPTTCTSLNPPSNTVASNTNGNSSVPCGDILLTWSAAPNASSYDIFRNGIQIANQVSGASYTDTSAATGVSYSYTISSYSQQYGTSPTTGFSPGSIQASACQVNISLSDELIDAVNAQPYPYTSNCVGSQSGTASVIQQGELVEIRVDVCNTGTATAQNVVLTSMFDANAYHTQFVAGQSGETSPTSAQSNGNNASTETWNIGSIQPNSSTSIYVFMNPTVAQGSTQTLQRFINTTRIDYTSAAGNVAPAGCIGNYADAQNSCSVTTGYVPFNISASNGTTQQEIKP